MIKLQEYSSRTIEMSLAKQWCKYERLIAENKAENILLQIDNTMSWMA